MHLEPEISYQVGDYEFLPNRNLIVKKDQQTILEPMQSRILLLFIKYQGKVVSRELLEKEIWQGRIASEQAVNNKIADLRKVFNDNYRAPKYFKTHTKLGYELIANCQQIKTKPVKNINTIRVNKKLWSLIFLASVIFTLLPTYSIKSAKVATTTQLVNVNSTPITSEKGQEWSPNLSTDKKYLAYAHKSHNLNWHIKVKNIENNEVLNITQGLQQAFSPVWSKNEYTLYFVSYIDNKCAIFEASNVLTPPEMKVITTCGGKRNMSPLAIGPTNEWLYFSNLKNESTFVATRINLINGVVEDLTAPPVSSTGDYTLALSHDGNQLVFLRAVNQIETELMLLDINTRELLSLQHFSHKIYKLAWSVDNQEIIYLDENNNLSSFNIVSKKTNQLAVFQNKTLNPYLTPEGELFVVDGDFYTSDIYSVDLEADKLIEEEVISSSFQDYAPALGNTVSQIAYTSNKTGISQIWLNKNNKSQKLTRFTDFGFIIDKHFSPNDDSILFLRNSMPYILDIETLTLSNSIINLEQVASPIWMCDGVNVLVSAKENGSWNLYQINTNTLEVEKKLSHVLSIKSDCKNSIYYAILDKQKGIYKLSDNLLSISKVLPDYHSEYSRDWQIYHNALFLLQGEKLLEVDLDSKEKSYRKLPDDNIKSFRLSNGKLYFSKMSPEETHIKQIINYGL